ncbi:hypothetical protein N9J05_01175 [bacterium]|nr:hypothetical protein [bacterium]
MNNLEKYKKDLEDLILEGNLLHQSMQFECFPDEFEKQAKPKLKKDYENYIKKLKPFNQEYQTWYSESLVVLKQLLPDRVNDFTKLYEKSKTRKAIEYGNYVIEDYLQNLTVTRGYDKKGDLEHCDTKNFLLPFEKMVDYQVKCMLDPSSQNYRPYTKSELTPKNLYKKNTQRNIVFELDK